MTDPDSTGFRITVIAGSAFTCTHNSQSGLTIMVRTLSCVYNWQRTIPFNLTECRLRLLQTAALPVPNLQATSTLYIHLHNLKCATVRISLDIGTVSVSRSGPVWFFSLFWTRPGPDRSSEISFLGKNRTGLGKTGLHRSSLRYLSTLNRLRPRPV